MNHQTVMCPECSETSEVSLSLPANDVSVCYAIECWKCKTVFVYQYRFRLHIDVFKCEKVTS